MNREKNSLRTLAMFDVVLIRASWSATFIEIEFITNKNYSLFQAVNLLTFVAMMMALKEPNFESYKK